MAEIKWDDVGGDYESHPAINSELKKKGDSVEVEFLDDGSFVDKETIRAARKSKGLDIKVPPTDNLVFTVKDLKEKDSDKAVKSFWVKDTQYTNKRELKSIRDENGDTLESAKAKITKVQSGDPTKPSLKIESL